MSTASSLPTPSLPNRAHGSKVSRAANRLVLRIVWRFALVVPVVLAIAWAGMEVLSASRAYIAGEGAWSVSCREAVTHLLAYARTGEARDYQAFVRHLAVPLADRNARRGMLQGSPDDSAHRPFVAIAFLQRAVDIWRRGDAAIAEMERVGGEIHRLHTTGEATPERIAAITARVQDIDDRLTPLEAEFSQTLGRGYRVINRILLGGLVAMALMLIAVAWTHTRTIVARTLQAEVEAARSRRQAWEARERALVTLESIGDAVVALDARRLVDYVNPVAESLTGWTADEARGRPLGEVVRLVSEPGDAAIDVDRAIVGSDGKVELRDARLLPRQGAPVPVAGSATPIRDFTGALVGTVLVFRDVGRERDLAARLAWQAAHDPLTGLLNRREFEARVASALAVASDTGQSPVLLYLDLDRFKSVNDSCGHSAGDELLRKVCDLMRGCVRAGDTLARIGGDEFVALLPRAHEQDGVRVGEAIRSSIAGHRFSHDGVDFDIGVSVGVAVLEPGISVEGALAAADRACYMAKEEGRNRVYVLGTRGAAARSGAAADR